MDWRLELVAIPVSDVDRAKAFYTEQIGFNADHDHQVSDELRFVQLTPPGSACSISLGTGISDAEPGSVRGRVRRSFADDATIAELGAGGDFVRTSGQANESVAKRRISLKLFPPRSPASLLCP